MVFTGIIAVLKEKNIPIKGEVIMAGIRKGATKLKGEPIDLLGPQLSAGDTAPDFSLQSSDMSTVSLKNTAGKTRIIISVPSLDTPVCHKETKRFSDEVGKMQNVEVLCVSMDLPFAQRRWCGMENVKNIQCYSDHQEASFGEDYGVLISHGPLKRILSRAVFVVGADNKLKHVEYVKEIGEEPDYNVALAVAKG